ncbi:MAG: hypothetical protein U0174_00875 [Polyangiaceae bacterium]
MTPPPSLPPLSPAIRERLLAQVKSEPSTTRRAHVMRSAGALAAGLGTSFGIFAALGGLRAGERTAAYLTALLVCAVLLVGVLGTLALHRRTTAASPTHHFVMAAVGLPVGWALVTAATLVVWPLGGGGDHAPRHDLVCAGLSVAMGSAPLAASLYARRFTVFVASRWVGAAMGATWMTFGATLMTFACTCAASAHMLLGHVLPAALAGAVLGGFFGKRVLGFRSRLGREGHDDRDPA